MLNPEDRYAVWQELLQRPDGVDYKELKTVLARKEGGSAVDEDYSDIVRQDKKKIAELLKQNGNRLIEKKKGRTSRFFVESTDIKLVEYFLNEKVAQPYMAIIDMLSKCRGLLPEPFLVSLSEKYQRLSQNVNVNKAISFEADYDCMSELDVFPDIYRSLNESAIWVSFHPVNKPEEYKEGLFYPEYLKQYRSNWYAFGMFSEDGKTPVFQKIPLNNIDDYKDADTQSNPFVKSSVDYEAYFDDIIGVENSDRNEVETIKFRISDRMYQRLRNKPLHSTQSTCKDLDTNGFKGMKMNVKYNIELMRAILNLGSDIEIVEPAHIRKRVKQNLTKALKMYEK